MYTGDMDGSIVLPTLPGKWERVLPAQPPLRKAGDYDDDDIIDAWEKGQDFILEQLDRFQKDVVNDNLKRSGEAARKILEAMRAAGYRSLFVRLRPDEITKFDVIVAVDEESFVDPGFAAIYDLATTLERDARSVTLRLSFMFMPATSNKAVNLGALYGDGYRLALREREAA